MNWIFGILLDLILVAIVLLCIRGGSKNGFAKTVVGFLGIFVALILAAVLANPLAKLTYDKAIEKPVQTAIAGVVEDHLANATSPIPDKEEFTKVINEQLEKLPAFIRNAINFDENSEDYHDLFVLNDLNAETISQKICDTYLRPAALSVLTAIFFVLLFVILALIMKIVAKALKIVNKIPLLGGLNALLGGIAGLLKGAIIVLIVNWAVVTIVGDNSNLFGIITPEVINSSLVMKNLALINPLNLLLDKVIHPN